MVCFFTCTVNSQKWLKMWRSWQKFWVCVKNAWRTKFCGQPLNQKYNYDRLCACTVEKKVAKNSRRCGQFAKTSRFIGNQPHITLLIKWLCYM